MLQVGDFTLKWFDQYPIFFYKGIGMHHPGMIDPNKPAEGFIRTHNLPREEALEFGLIFKLLYGKNMARYTNDRDLQH